jgi:O-antigen ligase
MLMADNFLFILHQFIISFLCLFYTYYVWRDLASNSYEKLQYVSMKLIGPILIGFFVGLYGYLVHEWGYVSIFLAFAFSYLITLGIFDPKYAVGFFTFLLIARPWEYYKNELMLSMLRDISILCFLVFAAHRIFRKKYYFQWNATSGLLLFFGAWCFISILTAGSNPILLNDFYEVLVKDLIIYFLIVNVVDNKDSILPITAALFLAISEKTIVSFYKIYVVKEVVTDGDVVGRMTGIGLIENANDIAAILILGIPFTITYFNQIKNAWVKNTLALLVFVFYFVLIWEAKSRGATLGLGAYAMVWYWLKVKNKKLATMIILMGSLFTYVALSSIQRRSDDVEGSTKNRLIFWKAGANMAVRNPLFGVGYGGFINNLNRYANGNVGTEGSKMTAHSTWILVLAETGFVGFLLYVGAWIFTIRTAWIMKEDHPEYLLAIVAYGTVISFLSHTYMLYPYILIALTTAHGQFYNLKRVEKNHE